MQTLYLSKSRLNTYCLCPEKYRLTYIENIHPEKKAIPLIEGSALHHIVENSLIYGAKIPNIAQAVSEEFWNDVPFETTEYQDAETMNAAKDKILSEARVFLEKIGEVNTHQMETYFEHPLVNPVSGEIDNDIIIRGYADIIDSPMPDIMRIIDLKTTARTPNMEQGHRAMELTIYAYLMACTFGFHIEMPVCLLYLVRTKEPKVIWLDSMRSMPDFVEMHASILNIANAIRHELFWKNQGLQCSWCEHQEICFAKTIAA